MTLVEELRAAAQYTGLDGVKELLERAASALPRWRPIKTAPKDGTRVLATWANTWKNGTPHVEICEIVEDGVWIYTYDGDLSPSPPTHWMPLPPPPLASQGEQL